VAILSTGDELIPPGAPCPPGKLPASNGVMLTAMIERAGSAVASDRLIGDELPALVAALDAARSADIIITSGGASVGDHDLVRPALAAAGGTIDFWKIAMRPGKPLIVGTLGEALFLGLPGNPVSAMVTAALFLTPLLRHLAGARDPLPRRQSASLGAPMAAVGGRTSLVRAVLADGVVTPLPDQDSAAMRAAASANALIERPAHASAAAPGDRTAVFSFAELGLA
jgi:molybdopterin molybdotransferase